MITVAALAIEGAIGLELAVARRPSRTPASARTNAPVQIEASRTPRRCASRTSSTPHTTDPTRCDHLWDESARLAGLPVATR